MVGLTTPDIFWSSAVYMISVENVRFLTGVHAVLVPTCQIEKFGLQEKVVALAPGKKLLQYRAEPAAPYSSLE